MESPTTTVFKKRPRKLQFSYRTAPSELLCFLPAPGNLWHVIMMIVLMRRILYKSVFVNTSSQKRSFAGLTNRRNHVWICEMFSYNICLLVLQVSFAAFCVFLLRFLLYYSFFLCCFCFVYAFVSFETEAINEMKYETNDFEILQN